MPPSNNLDLTTGIRLKSWHGSAAWPTLASLIALMVLWRRRSEGRRTIRAMTSEQLRDLDLDVAALRREGGKPFWRA